MPVIECVCLCVCVPYPFQNTFFVVSSGKLWDKSNLMVIPSFVKVPTPKSRKGSGNRMKGTLAKITVQNGRRATCSIHRFKPIRQDFRD